MDWLAILGQHLDLEAAHQEVIAGVALLRLDDVPQLASAHRSGDFFQSGILHALIDGQSTA